MRGVSEKITQDRAYFNRGLVEILRCKYADVCGRKKGGVANPAWLKMSGCCRGLQACGNFTQRAPSREDFTTVSMKAMPSTPSAMVG